ncbi:unnamed protein product [Dovyalis caffra]|uniref:Cytochrome P450 n=1 Tax=Dovyalis caffra TaxID=77055 RepID=A0AAV1S0L6_9ROSI|nr:unnamed protein product [Dovyalis caffra]
MMSYSYLGIVMAALAVLIAMIWQFCWNVLWRPYALTKSFEKQGIKGPPYNIFYGSLREMESLRKAAYEMILDTNCNDISQKVLPYFHKWSAEYGEVFLYWRGLHPTIAIEDPEIARQVFKSGFFVKPEMPPTLLAFGGLGLGQLNGQDWVRHRTILNPAFTVEKLKVMTKTFAALTIDMIDNWKNKALIAGQQSITIQVSEEFKKLTSDIIAHIAFGSSYAEGMEAFKAQKELERHCLATSTNIYVPGNQFLPTPSNLRMWKLEKKVKNSLSRIILGRIESESTANLLSWTIFLLSLHQEWQERVREEVLRECGMGIPEADVLTKLKEVNMVLLETLRLYGAVMDTDREAAKDMKIGNLMIPKGVRVTIQFVKIHRSKEYWGDDANEFNPLRFKNGVSQAARHPNAFIAFGFGSRGCIGQNLAMLEMKMVLSLLLQQFSFSLSPEYKHAPANHLTLQPQYGVPVIVKPFLLSK